MITEQVDYFEKIVLRGKLIKEAQEFFRSFLYDNHLLQPNLKYLEDRRTNFDSSFLLLELIRIDFETFPYYKLGRLQIMMTFFSQKDLQTYNIHLSENYKIKDLIPNPILDTDSFEYKNDPKQGKIDYETKKKRIRSENEKIEEYNLKLKSQIEFLRDNIIPIIYFNQDIDVNGLDVYVCEMADTHETDIELFVIEVVQNNKDVFSSIRRIDTSVHFYYDNLKYKEKTNIELEKITDKKNKQLYVLTKMTVPERIAAYYHKYIIRNNKLQKHI